MASWATASPSPTPTSHFRFQDLPGEIRNRVYDIVLCTTEIWEDFDDNPNNIADVSSAFGVGILTACRKVYEEARYVMLKGNLFIRVNSYIDNPDLLSILTSRYVPTVPMERRSIRNFTGFAMHYDITPKHGMRDKQWSFVILHRDFPRLLDALNDVKWEIPQHDESVQHTVTLMDPYNGDSQSFFSEKLQERLLAPCSNMLSGISHFEIKGVIEKSVSSAVVSKVRRSPYETPESLIKEIETLKAEGNSYFRRKDGQMANQQWALAISKLFRVMNNIKVSSRLRKIGGAEFCNKVTALLFNLYSNSAQYYLDVLKENTSPIEEEVWPFFEDFSRALNQASRSIDLCPESTWQPSDQQLAKLYYRNAVGMRISGIVAYGMGAEIIIERARNLMPDDREILSEKEKIEEWKRRVRCNGGVWGEGFM